MSASTGGSEGAGNGRPQRDVRESNRRRATAPAGDAGDAAGLRRPADRRRARPAAAHVLAPTNAPLTNPAAIKATVDTGGSNLVRGARNLVRDMSRPPRIPAMVDTSAFEVGRDLAVTPGAVVLRTPVLELIQYEPQTPQVREHPLLLVPPMIGFAPQHGGRCESDATWCAWIEEELTYQAATAVEDDPRLTKIASMARLFASDTAMRVTTEAVQVLGGNGYLKDFPAERMMRDAKVLQIYEGANEIQCLVVARELAREAAGREPVWPECMPGAEGMAPGQGAPEDPTPARSDADVGALA